jgi:hypothetical protein
VRDLDGGQVGIQRCLGINNNVAAIGQADDHVRAQAPGIGVHRFLFAEVAVFDHPGKFGQPLECHFTPLSAYLGTAQGLDQIAGLVLQQTVGLGEHLQLAGQGTLGLAAFGFHAAHLLLVLVQCLADGFD